MNLENRKKVFGCIFGMLEIVTVGIFGGGRGVNLENRKKVFGCIFGMLEIVTVGIFGGEGE